MDPWHMPCLPPLRAGTVFIELPEITQVCILFYDDIFDDIKIERHEGNLKHFFIVSSSKTFRLTRGVRHPSHRVLYVSSIFSNKLQALAFDNNVSHSILLMHKK